VGERRKCAGDDESVYTVILSHPLQMTSRNGTRRVEARKDSEMTNPTPPRPKREIEPIDESRLSEELSRRIDAWIAAQPEPRPTRSEAIRRLLADALGKPALGGK